MQTCASQRAGISPHSPDPDKLVANVLAWLTYRRDYYTRNTERNARFNPDVEAYTCAIRLVNFAQMTWRPETLRLELERYKERECQAIANR